MNSCQNQIAVLADGEVQVSKFQVGDFVHIGYCRAKIVGLSNLKGYDYVIRLEPTRDDCIGSQRMMFKVMHVSESVTRIFKLIK